MGDTLIIGAREQFAIPLSQVAHFRIDTKEVADPLTTSHPHEAAPGKSFDLYAVSKLPRENGTHFEILIDHFDSFPAVLRRIKEYKAILER